MLKIIYDFSFVLKYFEILGYKICLNWSNKGNGKNQYNTTVKCLFILDSRLKSGFEVSLNFVKNPV